MSGTVYPLRGTVAVPLRPYQQEALAAIAAAEERGIRRQLLVLPTGAGKTIVFASFLAQRPGRALVLAHRDELIEQAVDKIGMVWPGLEAGVVKAERNEVSAPVVVASVQTLARERRLQALVDGGGPFATVVTDEAHHAAAATYQAIYEALGVGRPDGPLSLGVTATPDRGDGLGLDAAFDEIVYEVPLVDLIEASFLSDIRAIGIRFEADETELRKVAGDISEASAARWFLNGGGPAAAGAAIKTHAPDRKTLAFLPDVKTAHDTAATIAAHGIPAAAVDGSMPLAQRRDILERFRRGELQALANCAVLTEGYDEPSVDCVLIARPTTSRALYCQMVGRGTRRYPGKDHLLILDMAGTTSRHDLESPASLFGLEPGELGEDETVTSAIARKRTRDAIAAQAQLLSVKLEARIVNVLRSRPARWIETGDGRFVLPAGSRHIVLAPQAGAPDRWTATVSMGGQSRGLELVSGASLELATGFAEDHARAAGAAALIDPGAAWRAKPPTDKQIAFAKTLGIAIPDGITCGELSDRISATRVAGVA